MSRVAAPTLVVSWIVSWIVAWPVGRATAAEVDARARVGINLAAAVDWSAEQPCADFFRLSRRWISQRDGAGWGEGPPLDIDERGWIRRLEPGCHADTPLCSLEPGDHYPAGTYTVLHEGRGDLEAWGAARVTSSGPGRVLLEVDPARGGFFLRLRATDPGDPLRAIRVFPPGEDEGSASPWRRAFVERWRGMACLRFMDLQATNDSPVVTWGQRPVPDDARFTDRGVPLELLCDLANRLGADPWFCIPHGADDDFVRRFGRLVRDRLDPRLRAWVEYSNEVWNPQFTQHRHAAAEGARLGLADKPWEAAWRYTALRSMEIFAILEEEFSGRDRLVRVLASQAANAHVAREILAFRGASSRADVLAIAPYVSFNVAPGGVPGVEEVREWSVDRVLDHVERVALPECVAWMRANREVAAAHGLGLVAYEAGQHLVATAGGENDQRLVDLLAAANRHPRMEAVYAAYLSAWKDEGGGLLCHFSSMGPYGKFGSWGLLEYADTPVEASPKLRAVTAWAGSLGQTFGRGAEREESDAAR